jgi:hypothetical protein
VRPPQGFPRAGFIGDPVHDNPSTCTLKNNPEYTHEHTDNKPKQKIRISEKSRPIERESRAKENNNIDN